MAHYATFLRLLYETPTLGAEANGDGIDRETASEIIENVRSSGRSLLTEYESKQLLCGLWDPHRANTYRQGPGGSGQDR